MPPLSRRSSCCAVLEPLGWACHLACNCFLSWERAVSSRRPPEVVVGMKPGGGRGGRGRLTVGGCCCLSGAVPVLPWHWLTQSVPEVTRPLSSRQDPDPCRPAPGPQPLPGCAVRITSRRAVALTAGSAAVALADLTHDFPSTPRSRVPECRRQKGSHAIWERILGRLVLTGISFTSVTGSCFKGF